MNKGQLFNMMSVAVVALVLAVWSFMSGAFVRSNTSDGFDMGGIIFGEELSSVTPMTVRLNGRDSVTLLSGSTAKFNWDDEKEHIDVELVSGGVLYSTLADDFSVSIKTDFARVDSQNNIAYVGMNEVGDNLQIVALEHSGIVTFVSNGVELNSLSIPGGYKMKIPSSKVSSTLAKLRLTKLSKEFPVFVLTDADISDEVESVYKVVEDAYSASSVGFLAETQDNSDFGPAQSGVLGLLHDAYSGFRDVLTISPSAEQRMIESQKGKELTYAMTNLLYGDDKSVGLTWLSTWVQESKDIVELNRLYSDMFFVLPGDELYPVKKAVWEALYEAEVGSDPIVAFHSKFSEIESLLAKGSYTEAVNAYDSYQSDFEKALTTGSFDDAKYLAGISREYVLLEIMLRSNAVFYDADRVKLLRDLEDKILMLAGSDTDLNEERQAFVQSKLRFLENLFAFVMDNKVSIDDATVLASELIFEAESYMLSIPEQVAVKEYFASKLVDYSLSVEFINSPEFYSYDSFAEGLSAYGSKKEDILELNAYLQSVRTGTEEEAVLTLEEATAIAKSDLYSHGIQYTDVVSLGDNAYRLFEITDATTGGYRFTAKYEREIQMLYDVTVGDIRFSTGLMLDTAKAVIEQTMTGDFTPTDTDGSQDVSVQVDEVDENITSDSLTDTVAISLVKTAFEEAGFDASLLAFDVVDLATNTFTFEGLVGSDEVPVSGAYNADSGLVSEAVCTDPSGKAVVLTDGDLVGLIDLVKGKCH